MIRILYIEDNALNREMLQRRLSEHDFVVNVAESGESGLERARSAPPDVILMDMGLPGLSGYDLTRRFRADKTLKSIPIIALTAHSMAGDRQKALDAGCDDYDTKPVDFDRIARKIRQQLTPSEDVVADIVATAAEGNRAAGRILVIDDDRHSRNLLRHGLELEDFEVDTASDGRDAIIRVNEQKYDLALLDLMMPEMNGFEVLEIIRASHSLTAFPVIMVTAMDTNEDVVHALRLGANDYVTKPVNYQILLARIQTLLRVSRLEDQLRQEKEFNENLIDCTDEMIISVDPNRRITGFNRAAARTFGYTRDEVIGHDVSMLYADSASGLTVHNKTLHDHGYSGEIVNADKNGRQFTCRLSVSLLYDKAGNPAGLVGISRDVTEEKRLETERKKVEALKHKLVMMATHDLKNPLVCIAGHSYFLKSKLDKLVAKDDDTWDSAESISNLTRVMQRLVEDFLDFQAVEDGRVILNRNVVDLNAIVLEMIAQNRHYAREKKVTLVAQTDAEPARVSADPDRIRQVIRNLLDNALKFSSPETTVTITARNDNGNVLLHVCDEGPGLSEDDLVGAFEPFTILDNQPTGDETSTGLGLAICRQFIDLHDGKIGVRNNNKQGATFWFSLPGSENQPE